MNCLLNNLTVVVCITDRTDRILLITCCTKIEVKFWRDNDKQVIAVSSHIQTPCKILTVNKCIWKI